MRELLITEITRMGNGFCVIGLERKENCFASVRPVPWGGGGWLQFQYDRGDRITFDLDPMPAVTRPHVEDVHAAHPRKRGALSESVLVDCLKQAEVSTSVQGLFGHPPHAGTAQGACVPSQIAARSVCGCGIERVRLLWRGSAIRATLALPSGETLNDLPLIDRDWWSFADTLQQQEGARSLFGERLQEFFNRFVSGQIAGSPIRFARIGLSREYSGCNWLMLDSLFPLPKPGWLAEFRNYAV